MAARSSHPAPDPIRRPMTFEDQVRMAYFTPSPATYEVRASEGAVRNLPGNQPLGKIFESQLPHPLDHEAKLHAHAPGPGMYDTPDLRPFALPEGGRVNRAPPMERIHLDEYPVPAPHDYGLPNDPTVPRQLYGTFGKDPRVSKFIQDEVLRSRSVPAPGEHEVMESMESMNPFCPEGGRYLNQHKPTSYFDAAAKLHASKGPSPDRYNLPGAIRPNKAAGKLVWKYQSETLKSSKDMVQKLAGSANEAPGPGSYDLPEPRDIDKLPVPTLKGRQLAHAMPHPFAYNCAPDYAGKYDTPVRQQNSGDQIYGRDFQQKTAAGSKAARLARAAEQADQIAAANMPRSLLDKDVEQPGETVQWKSGGFAPLRKVKSTGAIVKKEHPAVEELGKHYPMLSKFHGRDDKTFTPMATRKPQPCVYDPLERQRNLAQRQREHNHLGSKKALLELHVDNIEAAAAVALEPLDEEKLKEEATLGLMDKARFRMRMEGLGKFQQDMVLAEFPRVLRETHSPASPSAPASVQASVRGSSVVQEPFSEPIPRAGSSAQSFAGPT